MLFLRLLRSVTAIIAGIMVISLIAESMELGLVTVVHGELTTDPDTYFAIRNRPWFLCTKLAYNTMSAVVGGYVAVWLAGYRPVEHAMTLGGIQSLAFLWALSQPDLMRWTPLWMWLLLMFLSFLGILLGARLWARRASPARAQSSPLHTLNAEQSCLE